MVDIYPREVPLCDKPKYKQPWTTKEAQQPIKPEEIRS